MCNMETVVCLCLASLSHLYVHVLTCVLSDLLPTLLLQTERSSFNAITRTCSLFMNLLISDTENGEASIRKATESSSLTTEVTETPSSSSAGRRAKRAKHGSNLLG